MAGVIKAFREGVTALVARLSPFLAKIDGSNITDPPTFRSNIGAGTGSGDGTVTSVAASVPSGFTVTGSPVTSSGTLAITYTTGQTANRFLATPSGSTGALSLRAMVKADTPSTTVHTDQANTFSSNLQTFSAGISTTTLTATGIVTSPGTTAANASEYWGSGFSGTGYNASTNSMFFGRNMTITGAKDQTAAFGNGITIIGNYSATVGYNAKTADLSVALGWTASAQHSPAVAIGPAATTTAAGQIVIGSSSYNLKDIYLSGVTATSPVACSIGANGGSGTNIAGGNMYLNGGAGTGSAAGGKVGLKSSLPGASATTLRTLVNMIEFDPSLGTNGGFGFLQTAATARSTGWAVSNYTTTKTLNMSTATATDIGNFAATIVAELLAKGFISA